MQPIIGGGQFSKYELQRAPLIFECVRRKQREDNVAKGQLRSGREKKKPKAEKNRKKKSAPSRLAILARADNWERRFRQEIPVAHKAAATDHGMR